MIWQKLWILLFLTGITMASMLDGKYQLHTLKNGLQVVLIPMKNETNVVTTDIFYKVGSRNETMGKTGIAHMLEHLNFKSTDNLEAGEFDEIIKAFGGVNNASTSFDYTHYFIKSSQKNVKKSLELFAELMQNLSLKDEEFQPERDVVAEERRWRTDNNPIGYLYFRLFNTAFTYHPYHWTPIGFMEDIQTWKIEDIRKFHSIYYQPQNAIIVVAGDFDEEKVFRDIKKTFESIQNKTAVIDNYIDAILPYADHEDSNELITLEQKQEKSKQPSIKQEPKQDGARRVMVEKSSEVEMIAIAYKIPNFEHPDQPTLSVISELLSSGKSSRLHATLVNDKQLVNQIYAYNMENIDPGVFLFLAVCNPGVAATDVEKEILNEIEKIKTEKVSKDELEKIKISVKADFIYSMESSSSLADLFGAYLSKGNLEPMLTYEDRIEAMRQEDIITVANRYFKANQSTTIILKKDTNE
jgi:predicted Zn-dependent peptidase